ncbi:MAG: Spy0128 family protein [Lentihominibacter sp.]|jgi:pilin isopeptide linkage protein
MTKKACLKQLNIRRLMSVILAMILSATVFACPSFAATYNCYIEVAQTIDVKGSYSKPHDEIQYSLEPVSGVMPLPDGTIGASYNFGIRGEAIKVLSIRYDLPGEYIYTLRQLKPDAKGYTHDETIYTVTVVAENTPGGAVARVKTIVDSDGYKRYGIIFQNEFTPSPGVVSKVKTGDVSYLWTWITMSLISGIIFLMLIIHRRGNRNEGAIDKI